MIKHSNNIIQEHLSINRSLENLKIIKKILINALNLYKGKGDFNFELNQKILAKTLGYSNRKMERALLVLKNVKILKNPHDLIYTLHPRIKNEIKNEEDIDRIIERDVTTKEEIENVFEESKSPNHAAISLAGEPTLYPKIGELVQEFRNRGFSTFIVTNGTHPDVIQELHNNNQLPTQLYVTLAAPNRKSYLQICKPLLGGGWENLQKTLSLLPTLPCRTVVRITAVKYININLDMVKEYAEILTKNPPNFIDIKGFTVEAHALQLDKRWADGHELRDHRPTFEDILEFAKALEKETAFEIIETNKQSVDILLRANWPKDKSIKIDYSSV